MTFKQIEELTEAERSDFTDVKCHTFDINRSLEDYTESVRDYIYIWRCLDEGKEHYTWEYVSNRVEQQATTIKKYYDEQALVDDAAVDVDYCCG